MIGDLINKLPIIGIMRNISADVVDTVLQIYADSGLNQVEITMNTPNAATIIKNAVSKYRDTLYIGAGTVCTLNDLNTALNAGAKFIVTPIVNEEVITACVKHKVPIYPGAYTPTEIYKAWSLGAEMVKVFPASSLGPSYIRDVKATLNTIKLLPTGGINLQNMSSFEAAGADGFGIGSPLFDKAYIQAKNWEGLKNHISAFANK